MLGLPLGLEPWAKKASHKNGEGADGNAGPLYWITWLEFSNKKHAGEDSMGMMEVNWLHSTQGGGERFGTAGVWINNQIATARGIRNFLGVPGFQTQRVA